MRIESLLPARHVEAAFETVIEAHLLEHGYAHVRPPFDGERAIFPNEALHHIRTPQPEEWARLEAPHGDSTARKVLRI
jgi:type I restriction enzyme R subunit